MTQTAADRTAILAALGSVLAGVTNPSLAVYESPPWVINQDRQCNYWYEGDEIDAEYRMGANSRHIREKFKIQVFWNPPSSQQLATSVAVVECWATNRNIAQALQADTTLGGTVGGVDLQPTTAGLWERAAGNFYYSLEIPVQLQVFDAETVGRS